MPRLLLFAVLVLGVSGVSSAQDCPVKHPAFTSLDHATMLAAYTASFRGMYGRYPTMQAGGGVDDGEYWIKVSDHYGEFSDGICRAGWNAYWEAKLTGLDAVPPQLGDQPARFRPDTLPAPGPTPVPTPTPTPVPPPGPPAIDFSDVIARLAAIQSITEDTRNTVNARADQTDAHLGDLDGKWEGRWKSIAKWATGPTVAAILTYLMAHSTPAPSPTK